MCAVAYPAAFKARGNDGARRDDPAALHSHPVGDRSDGRRPERAPRSSAAARRATEGWNTSILFMLAMPVAMGAFLVTMIVRSNRRRDEFDAAL